jgi:hypothetical protein
MKRVSLTGALSAVLALGVTAAAYSQAIAPYNPTPSRASTELFDFENGIDGWTGGTGDVGTAQVSLNADPQYASDGTKSLAVDLTGQGNWVDPVLTGTLSTPVDLSQYHALSMDVFVPEESRNPDNPDGWFQFFLRVTDSSGTTYYNTRNTQAGWNHIVWDLKDGAGSGASSISFATGTDDARRWTGPAYIDNIRVWKDPLPGIHSDEKLIQGFDDASLNDMIVTNPAEVTASVNTDKQFVKDGTGSLMIDMSGQNDWSNDTVKIDGLPAFDLTNATGIHIDFFIPTDSAPTDWSEFGFGINGEGGSIDTATQGYLADQWNTLEIPLSSDTANAIKNVTGLYIMKNSGDVWHGPIYVDNLRAVYATGGTAKGDLNGDGSINIQDATLSLRMAVGLTQPSADQQVSGDVNGDGNLNIQDTTLILQFAVGGITKFPGS